MVFAAPDVLTIPAGGGGAAHIQAGASCRVVNTHGTQVVDLWAFPAFTDEYLSMEHTREVLQKIYWVPGDTILSNTYRSVLTFVADNSPGDHDTLIAACNKEMFLRAGRSPEHASCAGNLLAALASVGLSFSHVPTPWNLFMIARVSEDGSVTYERTNGTPGDHVELRAECDLTIVLSACPDDIYPTNGGDGRCRDAQLQLLNSAG
jgi:hypothetical protein